LQTAVQAADGFYDIFEGGAFLAERLCVFRFVPDIAVFQLAVDFFQAIALAIVVKDTSSGRRRAP
jgi:hypothetical protein